MSDKELTPEEERIVMINLVAASASALISKDIFTFGEPYETIVEVIGAMLSEELNSADALTEEALKPMDAVKNLKTVPIFAARTDNVIIRAERIVTDEPKDSKTSSNVTRLH